MHLAFQFHSAQGFALASASGCLASYLVYRGLDAGVLILAMSQEFSCLHITGGSLAPSGVSFDIDQARWEAQGQVQPRLEFRS